MNRFVIARAYHLVVSLSGIVTLSAEAEPLKPEAPAKENPGLPSLALQASMDRTRFQSGPVGYAHSLYLQRISRGGVIR